MDEGGGGSGGSTAPLPRPDRGPHRHSLTITHLSSYEGMGIARATCVSGCSCAPIELDGHRGTERQPRYVSIWEDREIALEMMDSSATCVVALEVLGTTRSGANKFKVKGLVFR